MKLSTRSRYGLRALLDIATHQQGGPVRLREIARRQGVSLSYLEHVVGPLIARGLLQSRRGINGGVSLTQHPSGVRILDAVDALEGGVAATDCVKDPGVCPRSGSCATRSIWVEVTAAIEAELGSRTLADLLSDEDVAAPSSCVPDAVRPFSGGLLALSGSGTACGEYVE